MSVSLVVLRFEIEDDQFQPSIIVYTAPKILACMSNSSGKNQAASASTRISYAKVLGKSKTAIKKEDLQRHRGKRDFHEITIETVKYEDRTHENLDDPKSPVVDDVNCIRDASKKQKNGMNVTKSQDEPNKLFNEHVDVSSFGEERDPSESLDSDDESSRTFHHRSQKLPTSSCLPFFSGNPCVEVTKGILHLFKENEMTSLNDDVPRSEMICLLAVPATLTIHDLMQFTACVSVSIEYLRIIRDSTPNQFMVLIKFRNQKAADEFYKTYNGVRFNSIEPEVCHLVYVSTVETTKESSGGCLPIHGHTELPTCPVCLERMDESVDGILTILCNHSFHGNCLFKWGDTSCPVCRYCQTPEVVADHQCFQCGLQESLWICLICGHVGCGRYAEGHAYRHFEETQHTYSMQLGNNRVWDYAGDNYVHRLIQNKGDGKIVEFEENRATVAQEEKLDSITLEYTYLLTSQLESQRLYFEEKITRLEKDAQAQNEVLENRTKKTLEEFQLLDEKFTRLLKEKVTMDKKTIQLASKLSKVTNELIEEKELNKCLLQNQQIWQSKVAAMEKQFQEMRQAKDEEIADLKEQLRDVMFYLEAQQQINNAPEETRQEIQEGQIVISEPAASAAPATPKRGRRKKTR